MSRKLNVEIPIDKVKKLTKADREILIDGYFGIIEAKLATEKRDLKSNLKDAIKQIYGRYEKCDKYRKGVAFSTYVNEFTGDFEYVYKVVTPETKDKALQRSGTKKMRGEKL